MSENKPKSFFLGLIFLLQAVSSLISNALLLDPLLVTGDIVATMENFLASSFSLRSGVLGELITAMGIVALGALLFSLLRRENHGLASVALGLYVLEAGLLALSQVAALSFLHVSQASALAGHPPRFQAVGTLALSVMETASSVHMLPFCVGALLFYFLLFQSKRVPGWLSLWGLITTVPMLVGTVFILFGFEAPIALYVPYIPFEFFTGVWLMIKGYHRKADKQ
jgi:hypothetical protein